MDVWLYYLKPWNTLFFLFLFWWWVCVGWVGGEGVYSQILLILVKDNVSTASGNTIGLDNPWYLPTTCPHCKLYANVNQFKKIFIPFNLLNNYSGKNAPKTLVLKNAPKTLVQIFLACIVLIGRFLWIISACPLPCFVFSVRLLRFLILFPETFENKKNAIKTCKCVASVPLRSG